ncbi:hypothetical protein H7A76_16310 [Pseudomonas sp. MSSRFD41]|uniref:hypothetical protein n=1 Tax=Pseudomonas sp. MSSRFD41 TaxID=1310370 RepID=UPI0016397701|nr:hypothetical protein [Pseudomonas sp. MSSRFD41]MBC2657002.1 hypothetical protein [Pseudomonas sp. MSSRFD41]
MAAIGGFSPDGIHSWLDTLDDNDLSWSSTMVLVSMGPLVGLVPGEEWINRFRRTDAQIARSFARIIFLCDHRQDIAGLQTPALIAHYCDETLWRCNPGALPWVGI